MLYYSGGRRGYDREYRSYDPRRTRSVSDYDYAGRRRNKYVMSDAGSDRYVYLFYVIISYFYDLVFDYSNVVLTYNINQIHFYPFV